jgi:hypothetical protein
MTGFPVHPRLMIRPSDSSIVFPTASGNTTAQRPPSRLRRDTSLRREARLAALRAGGFCGGECRPPAPRTVRFFAFHDARGQAGNAPVTGGAAKSERRTSPAIPAQAGIRTVVGNRHAFGIPTRAVTRRKIFMGAFLRASALFVVKKVFISSPYPPCSPCLPWSRLFALVLRRARRIRHGQCFSPFAAPATVNRLFPNQKTGKGSRPFPVSDPPWTLL